MRLYIILLLGISFSFNALSSQTFNSGVQKNQLIELYTSQGCSSCPPAERWISTYLDNDLLWKKVVPVNFHVDYWDKLGWADLYASPVFTQRQRLYKTLSYAKTVGTPGFIIDGKGWNGWFYGLKKTKLQSVDIGSLNATITGKVLSVSFSPDKTLDSSVTLNVTRLGFGLLDKIKNGENGGKLLRHDFVALTYQKKQLSKIDGAYESSIILDNPSVLSALSGLAIWVTQNGDPTPLQSVGGFLKD